MVKTYLFVAWHIMDKSSVPIIIQTLLEQVLCPEKFNSIFEGTAVEQYTRTLLFSSLFELMNLVVFKTFPFCECSVQRSIYRKATLWGKPKE